MSSSAVHFPTQLQKGRSDTVKLLMCNNCNAVWIRWLLTNEMAQNLQSLQIDRLVV